MENFGRSFEEIVDIAAPFREEWAIAKINHMCFHGGPDNREHIASWAFNTVRCIRRDTSWMLANSFQALNDSLAESIFVAGNSCEYSDFCNQWYSTFQNIFKKK